MATGRESPGLFGKLGLRGLLKLRRALINADRAQDLKAEAPEVVMFDDRSKALLDRARELAEDERDDPEAVQELVRLAGRHRRALQVAALGARQDGEHLEYPLPNLAHRLLQAALTGRHVQSLSAAEQERLDTLEDFWDADLEEQWTKLITAEPRLLDLAIEARAGKFGRSDRDAVSWINLPRGERKQAAGDALRHGNNLRHRLSQLVGPESGHSDVVLSSRAARDAAWSYLDELRVHRP